MRPELARHLGRTEDQILPCPLATQPAGWLIAQLVLVVLLLWPGLLRAGPVEEALTGIPQSYDAARQSVETWPDGVVENANLLSDVPQPRSQQGEDRVLGEPSLAMLDTRIILVQLVQNTGANEHLKLLQAQRVTSQSSNGGGTQFQAVGLMSGDWTLDGLKIALSETAPDALTGTLLHMPLFIQHGARLSLKAGETIRLDRESGAFIANFGELHLRDARIAATADKNPQVEEFSPFVVTSGMGQFFALRSRFEGLGFGKNPSLSGVSIGSRGLYRFDEPVSIVGSVFQDVMSVTLMNVSAPVIRGNMFADLRSTGLELRSVQGARVERNVFLDVAGDAIRLSNQTSKAFLDSNQIYQVGGHGILVRGESDAATIRHTNVWRTGGSAVSIHRSDCVRVQALLALETKQKAVSFRSARAAVLEDSQLIASRGSGVHVADVPMGVVTVLNDNLFAGNRVGISTASPSVIHLSGNNFADQFPRFLKGDIAHETFRVAGDLTGLTAVNLAASGLEDLFLPPITCTHDEEG